ncbi:MAG: ABC transporter substrate-binding protein [Actinomycetota bacterium]
MVRRLTMALVAIALVAVACSKAGPETTIRLQAFGDGEEVAAYQTLIDAFEDENPDIAVELIAIPSQGDHMAKLAASFASGDQPEVWISNYRRMGQLARNGAVEPIRDLLPDVEWDDFYDIALDAFTVDGKLQCAPQNVSNPVIYYNTEIFADAGVQPPKDGWSWEEFIEVAKKVTLDTDDDGEVDIYGFGVEPSLIRLAPFVWQNGGQVVDDTRNPTRIGLLGEEAVEAMSWFLDLRREHKVSPQQDEVEAEGFEDRFANGRLAMLMESRRAVPDMRAVEGLEFDVLPLPKGKQSASVLHSDGYCVSTGIENLDATKRFVSFALSKEGAGVLAETGRTVPSRRSVAVSDLYFAPGKEPANAGVWISALDFMHILPNIAAWNEIEGKADPIVEEWYYSLEPPEALGIEIDLATRGLFTEDAGP